MTDCAYVRITLVGLGNSTYVPLPKRLCSECIMQPGIVPQLVFWPITHASTYNLRVMCSSTAVVTGALCSSTAVVTGTLYSSTAVVTGALCSTTAVVTGALCSTTAVVTCAVLMSEQCRTGWKHAKCVERCTQTIQMCMLIVSMCFMLGALCDHTTCCAALRVRSCSPSPGVW